MKRYKLTCEVEAESLTEAWDVARNLPADLGPDTGLPEGIIWFSLTGVDDERVTTRHEWAPGQWESIIKHYRNWKKEQNNGS